jgi:acyl carrier protein
MERAEVKAVLLKISKENYDLDIDNFPEDAPLKDLQDINPKVDSMAIIELIFDVEDELDIRINNSDMGQPSTLAEIIDNLLKTVNSKK